MKLKKLVCLLLCVGMMIAALTGCTAKQSDSASVAESTDATAVPETASTEPPAEKTVLSLWDFHTGTEAETIQDMVNRYNASHSDVMIEYSSVNQTDYTTTLVSTAFANGESPDILWVEPGTYNKFVDAGILADLTKYYSDELKADILPSCMDAATADDGKIYTLPFECEILGLFYNIDTLTEAGIQPPKTWTDLQAAAAALTTDSMYGLVLPVENTGYTMFNWWPFMWMNGATVYNADGTLAINSAAMAGALDFWGSFFQNSYSPSSLQYGPWSIDNIGNGVSAMQVGGTYMINSAEAYAEKGINIGVVPLPSPDGSTYYTVAGGQMMGVCSQSKNVDAAADFIFWCFGDTKDTTNVVKWCTEAKFAYPARASVVEQNKATFEQGLRKDFTAFYSTAIPEPQYSPDVTKIVGDMLQNVMFGGMTGAEAAAAAEEQILALK